MTVSAQLPANHTAQDFAINAEQEQLRDMAQRFFDDHSPEAAVRDLMADDGGYDPEVWRRLAEETGLVGLLIPEEFGGSGLAMPDMQIVLQETGRTLYCGPYLSTALMAVSVLLQSGDQTAQARFLPRIAKGGMLMAVAFEEAGEETGSDPLDLRNISTYARTTGEFYRLSGCKEAVIDGAIAEGLLVLANSDAGLGIFHVAGDAAGLEQVNLPTFDPTRKLARVCFKDTAASLIGTAGTGAEVMTRCVDFFITGLAAEQLGGAQKCLDMAVDYAKTRVQFGRAIGSFQAVKHKCADLLLQIEAARSAVHYAGLCAGENADSFAIAASMAKAYCSDTFRQAAGDCLQIHGGIGFTWEHACHLYLKRAKAGEQLFGDPLHYRQRLAGLLEI